MSILFILAHPNPGKSRYNQSWASAAEKLNYPVHVLVDHINENGEFNIRKEQELLSAHQGFIISFPINWYAPVWVLQKWLADVLTPDFIHNPNQALKGKNLTCLISTGVDEISYSHKGLLGITIPELVTPIRLTANYVGMTYHNPFVFYGIGKIGAEKIQESTKLAMMHMEEFERTLKAQKSDKEYEHS